ncbi:MAG TPA: alkaline phosphatase family protein [Planctomycetota bacterium]|nr:alkaline phosphatase family protein [Planctomycetota bacterium]
MIAVDQMIPEQLQRLAPLWTGGFARFVQQGTVFREARLQYADSETGPGHTTYGTGMNPLHHGIVGNDWVLPEEKSGSYCVSDPDSKLVTATGPTSSKSMSPRNIRAPGLIDRLKALDPASRGFAASSKDRAAIGMSGQHPDLAVWWDHHGLGFVSSTWYAPALPAWVTEFDGQWLAAFESAWGGGWNALDVASFEGTDTAPDDSPGELAWKGRRVFPYPAPEIGETPSLKELGEIAMLVYGSPAGDQFVCELARRALTALALGKDEHVDVLCVSLSACDTVGHSFGPRSREVTDVLLRADRQLELLFADLDREVGAGRWIASLSADHGVLDLPEALVQRGIGAERVSGKLIGATIKAARKKMEQEFGEDFFLAYDGRGVRLSWTKIAAAGKKLAEVREFAAKALEEEGGAWIEDASTLDELEAVARRGEPASGFRRSLANSFDEERTPDVTLLPKPWKLLGMGAGTTHGTPYPYDVRIPLAFYGPGFSARESFEPASSVDAVPTLMAALGLEVAEDFDGHVLVTR